MAVLQLSPAAGSPLAYVGTFLLSAAFYALTAHLAARWVLGAVPAKRALAVGPVPALVSLLLQQFGPAVVIPLTLAVDFFAIRIAYRLSYRRAGGVALVHYTVAALLGITLFNLWRLAGTAPT